MSSWQIETECPMCKTITVLVLDDEQYGRYAKWKRGECLMQDAFPEFDADTREKLMTGICPACWDKIFES